MRAGRAGRAGPTARAGGLAAAPARSGEHEGGERENEDRCRAAAGVERTGAALGEGVWGGIGDRGIGLAKHVRRDIRPSVAAAILAVRTHIVERLVHVGRGVGEAEISGDPGVRADGQDRLGHPVRDADGDAAFEGAPLAGWARHTRAGRVDALARFAGSAFSTGDAGASVIDADRQTGIHHADLT